MAADLPSQIESVRSSSLRRNVSVSNVAVSGTTTTDWLPGGARYTAALATFQAAISSYAGSTPKALVVSLGTNDAHTSGTPADWQANMASTVAAFRSDLGLPSLPVIYTILPATVPVVMTPPAWDNWATIRSAQSGWNAGGIRVGVQMPDGAYRDGLHFDVSTNGVIAKLLSDQIA